MFGFSSFSFSFFSKSILRFLCLGTFNIRCSGCVAAIISLCYKLFMHINSFLLFFQFLLNFSTNGLAYICMSYVRCWSIDFSYHLVIEHGSQAFCWYWCYCALSCAPIVSLPLLRLVLRLDSCMKLSILEVKLWLTVLVQGASVSEDSLYYGNGWRTCTWNSSVSLDCTRCTCYC